jgi:signal transduction histidine kinase
MKLFLNLINSVVYHELRNPLNSLVSQIYAMEGFFSNFYQILDKIKQIQSLTEDQTKDLVVEL